MHGSIPQPGAEADGLVKKHFSADGSHFIFSSTSQFEPGGNESTGDVSIYDRNLTTDTTQVVSTDALGDPLTCLQGAGTCHAPGDASGIAELDVSGDGSRIVVGEKVSSDADGNNSYRLFMHIGASAATVALNPGASAGALFDGMTENGSRVFFTTKDHLLGADTDESADIYEASVNGAGAVSLRLLTTDGGTPSNDDSCNPPGIPGWNVSEGEGECSAVALAGGAGVATDSGTFYFFSPELLDGSQGEADQPNLYVVEPDSSPEFVATVDSSIGKPGPQPSRHPRVPGSFLNGLEGPESIAVDQSNGDLYITERETQTVSRYTSSGTPHDFSASAGYIEGNKLTGQAVGFTNEGDVAVDNAPGSPLSGDFYVSQAGGSVSIFANTGEQLGELNGFNYACGVAVDQSDGTVYVGDYEEQTIWRFEPTSGATPVSNANYVKTGVVAEGLYLCPVGTDSSGHVFAMGYFGGELREFDESEFEAAPPLVPGTKVEDSAFKIYTDPENDDRYIDMGDKIVWTDSSGNVIEEFGQEEMSYSEGVAVNAATKHVYVSTESEIVEFSFEPGSYRPIDNPAVVHGVHQSGTHNYRDFQVTPSGSYAAFTTRQPLDQGFLNEGFSEVYRHDVSGHSITCVSCPPTNAPATGDADLAAIGLSLADDGRVFFDTDEPIVLRDGDNAKDVYEWEEDGAGPEIGGCEPKNPNFFPTGICLSLISTGTSPFASSLLSVTADGTDALFFTHDTLAHEDENGPVTKLYDARTGGGFFDVPPPALCVASDECHGPGTREADPAAIRTIAGKPGNTSSAGKSKKKCKRGKVKRHGKCVRKKRKRKHTRKSRGGADDRQEDIRRAIGDARPCTGCRLDGDGPAADRLFRNDELDLAGRGSPGSRDDLRAV